MKLTEQFTAKANLPTQNRQSRRSKRLEMDQKRVRKLEYISKHTPRYKGVFQRAFEGVSRKAAMDAFCVECIGYEPEEIRNCTVTDCPLYEFRPRRTQAGSEAKQ